MQTSSGQTRLRARLRRPPRWLAAWLLLGALSGFTLAIARLTDNWTLTPTAIFVGALSGPIALATWVTDRTRVGRSVAPDVLFMTAVVGGASAIVLAGVLEGRLFEGPTVLDLAWVGLVEELAKIAVPLLICTLAPRCRTVERALALGVVAALGFAVLESVTYATATLNHSDIRSAHKVLFQRTIITAVGHIPWTTIAVVVAAIAWQRNGRPSFGPKALWGLALAIVLHTTWNAVVAADGWWQLFEPLIGATTIVVFYTCVKRVRYEGPYVAPEEHATGWRSRDDA
jgi:RsiW-degrading membrane proteinase PrsW (M82 family)